MDSNRTTNLINSTIMQLNNFDFDYSYNNLHESRTLAVNYITLPFDDRLVSVIPRYVTLCNPEYLVLNLYDPNVSLETIHNLLSDMSISVKIMNEQMVNIPLSLLWSLNSPQIINNNLYILLPLNIFFGDISLKGLNTNNNITVNIYNNNLQNYVLNFNLGCKIKMYSERNYNSYIDMSDNPIQTIHALTSRLDQQTQYQFNGLNGINIFNGIIKGIFIESNDIANQLTEIQCFINTNLHRYYDEFLIRTKTVKINDNLIYFPFNPEYSYTERLFNSFTGSLNLSNDQNYIINFTFNSPTNFVKIYLLKADVFKRRLYYTNNSYNNTSVFNNYGHTGSYGFNNSYSDSIYSSAGNTGNSGPSNYNITTLPIGQTIYLPIDQERNTCNILHEQIIFSQTYMKCSACNTNFNETALKQWLQHRTGTRRTCPSCREVWTNFNIYVNASNPTELICD